MDMRSRLLAILAVGLTASACAALHPPASSASGARALAPTLNPSPIVSVTNIQIDAPSTNAVWSLVNFDHLFRSTDQGGHWEQRPMPVGQVISFVDDHEGWLLSWTPAAQCDHRPVEVWHTSDAGTTWEQLPATGIESSQCKNGIWFSDSKHGLVAAWDGNHAATVYRTADGGKTWAPSTLLPNPPNYQSQQGGIGWEVAWVKHFGANLYLAAYGTPYIFKSTDGGSSWQWVTKWPSTSLVMVTETRWLDLSTPGQSMESVNGGQQFHPFASDFNYDEPKSTRFVFADDQVGYSLAAGGLLQRTVDGGTHWDRIGTPGIKATPAPTPAVSPTSIPMPSDAVLSAPSAGVVWALVAGQYLFRSMDQGKTWEQRSWVPSHTTGLIAFVDDTTGWALLPGVPGTQCTQQGVQLFRTTNGAATWKLVSVAQYGQVSPNGFAFEQCKEAMYFADSLHGFVGADDPTGETVYRTSDGGVTWSATTLPNPPSFTPGAGRLGFTSIKAFGGTVLAFAEPYVFESSDGGATWTYLTSAPQSSSREVEFVTQTRWLKIQSGLETTDAGKTWHSFTYGDEEAAGVFSTFVFATDKVGYATVRGDIRRTVDGGASFVMIKNSWP